MADDGAVDLRTRLSLWLGAADVYARAGRVEEAMGVLNVAGQVVRDAADAPRWAPPAIDVERLSLAARFGQDPEQMARSGHQIATVASDLPPTPNAVATVLRAAAVLLALGAAKPAEEHLERVLEATDAFDEAWGPRCQASVGLAEARLRIDGPEAAMEVQERAIAAIEPRGDTPMLVWARQGLAAQLLAADRFVDAAESFLGASEVCARLGLHADAASLRLEQAAALVQGDDPDGGEAVAEAVAEAIGDLPEEQRPPLEMRLHQVHAQVEAYRGDLDAAAEHWLEVADRASRTGVSPLEAQLNAAQLYAAADDMEEAAVHFARAELAAADADDPAKASAVVMRTHAEALRQAGRADEAVELARVAANHARAAGDEAQAVYLSVIAADSMHAAGDSAAALQAYTETITAARGTGMGPLEGAVRAAMAKVLRDLGRVEEADVEDGLAAELGIAPAEAEE